jgi:hypothetical protein
MKIKHIIVLFCIFFLFGNISAQQVDEGRYWIFEDFSSIWENNEIDIESAEIYVSFSNGSVDIVNPLEGKGVRVVAEGQHVVVNSTLLDAEVSYILSGNTTNGSIKIYSSFKFKLVLDGVNIQNPSGAAINIQSGKKATVILKENTINNLIDGTSYTANGSEDMKGTLFSEGQLVFEGKGNLSINGNYKHAICSDDYVEITDGTITINNAASDGVHANDYFRMSGGTLTITTSKDGIDCEIDSLIITGGNINITSTGQAGKALKSTGNMTISGGTINISTAGNAYYDTADRDISSPSGIKCGADMTISGECVITINSTGSAGKGISTDGNLIIDEGSITVTTSGGTFRYGNLDSAAKAIKSDGNLTVNGGKITIKTSGTGAEGLESKNTLTINGGRIEIEANDDAINATRNITINGGEIYAYSTTNDGIDSNGTLTITGGVIVSSGTTSPEEGFDCDWNTFKITGGILIGTGGATSSPTASVCTQYSLIYRVSNISSGQLIHIKSAKGEILTLKAPRGYSSMTLLFSSPDLIANTSHTIYTGGTVVGGTDFHGYYIGSTYTQGTQAATFTTNSVVTSVGNSGGGGWPGGW